MLHNEHLRNTETDQDEYDYLSSWLHISLQVIPSYDPLSHFRPSRELERDLKLMFAFALDENVGEVVADIDPLQNPIFVTWYHLIIRRASRDSR